MAEKLAYWEVQLEAHGYPKNPLGEGFKVTPEVRPEGMSHAGELWWMATLPNGETKWLVQVERIVFPDEGIQRTVRNPHRMG